MLLGEDFRRRHDGGLKPGLDGAEARGGGDHRLAASDVALHQPVHGPRRGKIAQDVCNRALLRAGQTEWKRIIKRGHHVGAAGKAGPGGARPPERGKACGKNKEFLENKPPPRLVQLRL